MLASVLTPLRRRRARSRARCWRVLLAASVAVTLAGQTRADAATPPFAIDIDDQQAIFQLTNLRPGPVGSRCLLVSVRNGVADEAVLSATVGGTGLADYLDLTVEVGTSADPATCTDFVGTVAFTGTVGQLGTLHADPATGVPLPLAAQTSAVVRFTLALQSVNAAQGRTATMVLRFDAQDASGPPPPTTLPPTTLPPTTLPPTTPATTLPPTTLPPTTPATSTPADTTTPDPSVPSPRPGAPTGPSTTVGADPTTTTTTTVATTTTAAPTTVAGPSTTRRSSGSTGATRTTLAPPATSAPADPAGSGGDVEVVITDPTVEPEPVTVVARAVEVVTETATTAAKTSSVPAGFLSFVFAFLVVQDRFDRNDPKLARAPLAPEPEMVFQPRRGRLGT